MPEDDDDSTAPAQFLLKLPESYSRRLSSLAPQTPNEWMLAPPVIEPSAPRAAKPNAKHTFLAALAGALVGVAIIAGGAFAFAQSSGHPVGISKRAPKKLDSAMRSSTRQSGVAPHVHAVPVESLQRHHAKPKHKR